MYILGVNAYHGDSSACILKDGEILAAVEEERFRRIKHWAGFPSESIKYCLKEAGINLSDVAYLAVNQDSSANLVKKVMYTLKSKPSFALIADRIKNKKERSDIPSHLKILFPDDAFTGKVQFIEHHLCHLASAYYVSPFVESVVVSVDGFGDFASAAWGLGKNSSVSVDEKVYFPHSLGIFYQALTQYLGFPNYGDEYKVMGLAPYGSPKYLNEMRQIVQLQSDGGFRLNLKYFRHHKEKVSYEWVDCSPKIGRLFSSELESLLGPTRNPADELTQFHKDVAHSIQKMYEEAFFHLLNTLYKKYEVDAISVAGGCGMNSVANGKIKLATPFKQVYIQSAAGDAGGAIGAALEAWALHGNKSNDKLSAHHDHAYWGPHYSDETIRMLLEERKADLDAEQCTVQYLANSNELYDRTASCICDGKVIGWFQGRMEWGPRALGNRSIVCDPRRSDMKDILNLKIKRRESFRPFAPSILREHVGEWFEQDSDVPFMMQVFQIREQMRSQIPAVTHADGSGRLQTVYEHTNSRYYGLISSFYEKTGVPMVLNTSFNENEPVVCQPVEALNCFLRTKMDVIVMGNWMVSRVAD
ncbi:MAG: carbamoyltransferase [Gammaproteobacteria bacterium]|nr:carbamoyltransferase [Gammaproteobacteria bacterium]MBJ54752.1 carbamoyltransferase [Gammaproteobacteria bacterium]|tara:strand:- start:2074 stop:3834 length:1761 start_codon:yes stop_codon:yes gene_type:complete